MKIQKLFSLKNKNIVLTGSAGRLGTQFAHILSKAGANIILVDIDETDNKILEQNLKKQYKTQPKSYQIDISNQNEVEKLSFQLIKDYKTIYGLINNAFYSPLQNTEKAALPFEKFPHELWNQMLNVNLTGVFLCSKEIGKIMINQKEEGVIVNISSIYGISGADQRIYGKSKLNSSIAYAATKGGIVNMTRYLAAYWQKKNIRVNTLTLGAVLDKYMDKEFIKNYEQKTMLGRMGNKEEFGPALLFLMSNASSYMTGANLVIDGGWTAW